MSEFKEFQGKTLDAAIAEACAYYDSSREKMEIEILEDAKSGIFGLVGARKARINARRVELSHINAPANSRGKKPTRPENVKNDAPEIKPEIADSAETDTLGNQAAAVEARPEKREPREKPVPQRAAPRTEERTDEPNGNVGVPFGLRPDVSLTAEIDEIDDEDEVSGNVLAERPAPRPERRPRERQERNPRPPRENGTSEEMATRQSQTRGNRRKQDGDQPEGKRRGQENETADGQDLSAMPRINLTDLDQDKLFAVTRQMVLVLVKPILGEEEPTLEIKVSDDRMQVQIQSDSTGLLIGRDGQNLAAVQYLVARMISRAMEAQVRVQVDAGDYHSRQDVRLQELAIALAEKVRATGKSQSTRPLSAYQRRVIHLALQEDPDVVTRSSGEGALKRVVVQRRKESNA